MLNGGHATMTELPHSRRMLILVICCAAVLMSGMDNTIVNIALPVIHKDLHASLSELQWVVDAYTLVLASLLMLSGSLGDRLGRRVIFLIGLIVFTTGSALCGLAPGLGWLIAFRCVQALGGSMLNPVAMAIITNVFTDSRERAFAIGVWGGIVGISIGLGPVIGGVLLQFAGWRSIFWVNVPIGIAAIVLLMLFVPESRASVPRRPDPVGQVLVILGLAALTSAIIEAPNRGWISAATAVAFGITAVAFGALGAWESHRNQPLIELRFFRSIPFSGATLMAVCAFGNYSGFLFLNTLYLQQVRGYSPLTAGLLTIPLAVGSLIFSPLSGRIVGARGPRIPLVSAGLVMTLGALMMIPADPGTPIPYIIVCYLLFSIGFGLVNTPITNTAVSGMPRSQAGIASGIATTSRQVGTTLGVAAVGSALSTELGHQAIRVGFRSAEVIPWWIVACCGIFIVVGGFTTSTWWAKRSATRVLSEEAAGKNPAPSVERLADTPEVTAKLIQ
ncbi:MAG TPA: MFS transporter [Frankiaceae bacterium]|nr:MFS transporter [Frankiaceae bacterium]